MKAWFEGRTAREQGLLAVLGASLIVFGLWFGVMRPAASARAKAEARHAQAASDAAVVSRAVARLKDVGSGRENARPGAPPADAAARVAAQTGLTLSRAEPDGAGGTQVSTTGTAGQIFPWLAALQSEYGVTAQHLTVIKDGPALSAETTLK